MSDGRFLKDISSHPWSHLMLAAAVAAGVMARVWGLGTWPLTTDEYFLGRSVMQILQYGFPRFECGGFYTRGLLQQYFTAPVVAFSSDPEWALRSIPMAANLLGLPAVYLIGRRLAGIPGACTAAALYSLSIWEIEFARFARMYAPFQTAFLWQLVLLLRVMVDGKKSSLKWMYFLAVAGLFIYEGAIFLMILVFLPFLSGRIRLTFQHALGLAGIVSAALFFQSIDFRGMGTAELPAEMIALAGGGSAGGWALPIALPPLLAVDLIGSASWGTLGFAILLLSLYGLIRLWSDNQTLPAERIAWTAILILAICNLFTLAFCVWAVTCCLYRMGAGARPIWSGPGAVVASVLVLAIFWTAYALVGANELLSGSGRFGSALELLFGYPDIYGRILRQWGTAMPITTGALLLFLTAGLSDFLRGRKKGRETYGFLFAALILSVLLAALLETRYQASRYTFFLYPLVLMLVAAVFVRVANLWSSRRNLQAIACYSLAGVFAFAAEDFGLHHLTHIATPEITFRTAYAFERQDLYTFRRDFSSPARFISKHREAGDIIVSAVRVADFYLDHVDFMYISYRNRSFLNYAACGGTRELWSNAPLVYRGEDLSRIISSSGRPVWVIAYADDWGGDERDLLNGIFSRYLIYTNIDRTINVYRIPPETMATQLPKEEKIH
jgi:hypothetical protein